jgi:sodium-independent sulfate anion transporter 11
LLYAGFGRQQRKKVPNGIFSFHNDVKKRRRSKNNDRATTSHSQSASGPSSAPHQHNYDEKISTMAIEDISEHRHQHASSSASPTTEPLETPSSPPPPRSCSTISSDPLDAALPPWCYCQDDEDDDEDDENDNHRRSDGMIFTGAIADVRDRYPYFFLSLHDAANAALHRLASTYPLCHYVTSQTLPNESMAIDMEKVE